MYSEYSNGPNKKQHDLVLSPDPRTPPNIRTASQPPIQNSNNRHLPEDGLPINVRIDRKKLIPSNALIQPSVSRQQVQKQVVLILKTKGTNTPHKFSKQEKSVSRTSLEPLSDHQDERMNSTLPEIQRQKLYLTKRLQQF